MEAIGAVLSRTEVLCGVFSLIGAVFGYLSVRATAAQEERRRKGEIEQAAEEARGELDLAAQDAKAKVKQEARRDAINEWQALYGEREKQVHDLANQNKDQQQQIDNLRAGLDACQEKHEECEDKHAEAIRRLEAVEGTVTKIANGNH